MSLAAQNRTFMEQVSYPTSSHRNPFLHQAANPQTHKPAQTGSHATLPPHQHQPQHHPLVRPPLPSQSLKPSHSPTSHPNLSKLPTRRSPQSPESNPSLSPAPLAPPAPSETFPIRPVSTIHGEIPIDDMTDDGRRVTYDICRLLATSERLLAYLRATAPWRDRGTETE